jgi:hypothetical protein
VAGPFLVPLAALLREVGKDVDVTFRTAQAFRYVPLNFVVNDIDFYRTELLEKQAYPGLYVNFVGWLPVLLAMLGLGAVASEERRIGERRAVLFLSLCVVLLVWVSSATPLRALVQLSPWQSLDELIGAWRNPSPIAGLAVAPLLALAAIGVQRLLDAPWPPLALALGAAPHRTWRIELETRWLLAIGLVAAVAQAASFSHQWVAKSTIEPMVHQQLDGLRTPGLEWVRPPFGEGVFVEPAVRQGLKVVDDMRPWYWRDHDEPQPLVLASRTEESDPELRVVSEIDGVRIYEGPPERSYATLAQADGLVVCTARGVGGDVDVTCPPHNGGLLTVKEHYTAGWHASAGGVPLALRPALWLTMELPAGQTAVQLRYRPWTRWLGVILCVLGLALAAGVWWCAGAQETAASAD